MYISPAVLEYPAFAASCVEIWIRLKPKPDFVSLYAFIFVNEHIRQHFQQLPLFVSIACLVRSPFVNLFWMPEQFLNPPVFSLLFLAAERFSVDRDQTSDLAIFRFYHLPRLGSPMLLSLLRVRPEALVVVL